MSAAHRGGRVGDYVEVTPDEYRELLTLRKYHAALLVLLVEAEQFADEAAGDFEGHRPTPVVPVSELRRVIA